MPAKSTLSAPRPVVLSVEQALSMPYATLRFVHLGWRVIRVEAPPVPGRSTRGDPNRAIGRPVGGADRHSYFVAPNVGKEAIVLDLKRRSGRSILHRLVRELPVDVFCTNTLPAHHRALGIDEAALRRSRRDLVWCSVSAMGTAFPDVPGYDPALQALCGYMDLTGQPGGPPLQCGPPLIDLKAGDEAFAQVVLALWERSRTGRGERIDVSMAQAAVSWLHTFLPMLDMGSPPGELRRSGNEHRQFIPVNAYPTRDGYLYVAIGSDAQWERFTRLGMFRPLRQPRYRTNEGRRRLKARLHAAIAAITRLHSWKRLARALARSAIPHAPITPIEGVASLPFLVGRLTRTHAPSGAAIRLPPPAVGTPFLARRRGVLPFAPGYGEHTERVLREIGIGVDEIGDLRRLGVLA